MEENPLTRWTITNPIKREPLLKLDGGNPGYCAYVVELWPCPECEGVEIDLTAGADVESVKWFPHVKRAFQKSIQCEREDGNEWIGIRVVVLRIMTHPVDTTKRACEIYGSWFCSFFKYDLTRLPD